MYLGVISLIGNGLAAHVFRRKGREISVPEVILLNIAIVDQPHINVPFLLLVFVTPMLVLWDYLDPPGGCRGFFRGCLVHVKKKFSIKYNRYLLLYYGSSHSTQRIIHSLMLRLLRLHLGA